MPRLVEKKQIASGNRLRVRRNFWSQVLPAAKKKCFEKLCELCEEANVDTWGTGYKIFMSKFKNMTQQPKNASFMRKVAEILFPTHHLISYAKPRNEVTESPLLIWKKEILAIALNLETTLGCSSSFSVKNLTALMSQSSENWNSVSEMSALIITELRHFQQIRRQSAHILEET